MGEADARTPGAEIEAAVVADGDAALDRGFLVRLAETATAIVADDGGAARNGDAVAVFVLGMGRRGKRRGDDKHAAARRGKSLHDVREHERRAGNRSVQTWRYRW